MGSWLPNKLPDDIEAERALLATLCAPGAEQAAKRELRGLSQDHFVHPAHRCLFMAMGPVLAAMGEFNAISLKDELERQGNLGRIGGFAGLVETLSGEEVGRPEALTVILVEKLRRRQIIRLGAQLVREASEGMEGDAAEIISRAMSDLALVARDGRKEVTTSFLEALELAGMREPFRDGAGGRGGWWGIDSLDQVAPIPTGQVTGIFARPGVGKTALATQIVCESAHRGRKPLFVQMELPKNATLARVASYYGKIGTQSLKDGQYDETLVKRLRTVAEALGNGGILCPRVNTPWHQIEATIEESIDSHGTDLVVLDYFGLIGRPSVAKGSNEAYAFAHLSEQITAFSKDHQGVGFVLLGQLKPDAAGREPKDGDAADSDRPARDAAVSLMLWRDAQEKTHAALRKNRDGPLGWKHELEFQGWCQRFQVADPLANPSTHSGESY